MRYEFHCPKCGSNKLEEVKSNVTLITEIQAVYEHAMTPGGRDTTGGEVTGYRCGMCLEALTDEIGFPVRDRWALIDFLKRPKQTVQV